MDGFGQARTDRPGRWPDRWDEAGEGVISTAIAVLIMALLGAAMWVAFDQIFTDAADRTGDQIEQIGGP